MTLSVSGDSITFNDLSTLQTAPSGFGFKNRIINGDMRIDQRNAGASVTITGANYTVDRWQGQASQTSKFTVQQSSTAPAGFSKSILVTSSSAYALTAGDYFSVQQVIEGFNTADLGWGGASAQAVTLSFRVRSSLTGVFSGTLNNSANNRSYPFTYTIITANTWEQKSVTIAGDTTGTWLTDNGVGVKVWFSLGTGTTYSGTAGAWAGALNLGATGATSVVGTSGATFYITGVQLEKGSTATAFDYRDYGRELIMCQRYYQRFISTAVGVACTGVSAGGAVVYPVQLRANPTIEFGSFSVGTFAVTNGSQYSVALYNSAGNWTPQTGISASFAANAEL